MTRDKIIRLVTSRTDNYNLVQLKVSIFNNYGFLGHYFQKEHINFEFSIIVQTQRNLMAFSFKKQIRSVFYFTLII